MRLVSRFLVVVCGTLAGLCTGLAQTEKRVALVIGNSAYQHTRVLPNPRNDAEAIAKLLRDIGFDDVAPKIDLDYRALREAVRGFGEVAREAEVALIYYAGHGLEVAGENYLVPTDAKLVRDAHLEYEAVTLASLLNAAGGARRLRVVILDACRNNPLGERIALRAGVARSVTRGLARIEPPGDVLVAYAAKAGTLAEDGAGRHSPFAEALLKHLPTPGLDVRLMFGKVRDSVLGATRQRQEPYTYGSLTGDVIALVPGTPLTKAQQVELMFWSSVKDSTSPAVLSTYLDRYPNGEFAPIARALIEHYERQLKLDLAKREEERKLQEAAMRTAEVKRLEDERRDREAALVEERRRPQEAKDAEAAKKLEDVQKSEALATAESVRKGLEEEAAAREAARLAEKNRIAALEDAEGATKVAEEAISKRREVEKSPAKLAALPKVERPPPAASKDGTNLTRWLIGTWRGEVRGLNDSRFGDIRTLIVTEVRLNGTVIGRWTGASGGGGGGTDFRLSGERLTLTTEYASRVTLRRSGANRLVGSFETKAGKRFSVTMSRQ